MKITYSAHSNIEMQRRRIDRNDVINALERPQQQVASTTGRRIIQNRYFDNLEKKEMLLRIVLEDTVDGYKVITVYKTSKIDKYWNQGVT
jgi:hypothetical protein